MTARPFETHTALSRCGNIGMPIKKTELRKSSSLATLCRLWGLAHSNSITYRFPPMHSYVIMISNYVLYFFSRFVFGFCDTLNAQAQDIFYVFANMSGKFSQISGAKIILQLKFMVVGTRKSLFKMELLIINF